MKGLRAIPKVLVVLLVLLPFAVRAPEAKAMTGAGTQEDPYVITTPGDLAAMHGNLAAHYALGADINMTYTPWTPVGNELDGAFTGSLNGRGYTIFNLNSRDQNSKFSGLFGYLEGSVTGVKLSEVAVVSGRYAGGIAGNAGVGSSITDCHVLSGSVRSSSARIASFAGGITGLCEGAVSGCSNGAEIWAGRSSNSDYFSVASGGIIGDYAGEGTMIEDCINTGTVRGNGNSSRSGGIVGRTERSGIINSCTNSGEVNGYYCGGIIGYTDSLGQVTDCSNRGILQGAWATGGIIGSSEGRTILRNCENFGYCITTTGIALENYVGGMIGKAGYVSLDDCQNSGTIRGKYAAGMAYVSDASSVATACKNTGLVDGGSYGAEEYSWPILNQGNISNDCKSVIYSVSISSQMSIASGESMRCSLFFRPRGTPLDSIEWSSSDESVATVAQDGTVTGHNYGTATISAVTTGLGLKSTCTIQVAPPMRLDPAELTLELGLTARLIPVRSPEVEDTYSWSSSSSSYVSVDSNGVITALQAGRDVTITAISKTSGLSASCTVHTVKKTVQATSVNLSQNVLRPMPGERVQLTAQVLPSGTTDKSVVWESSDSSVADVSGSGVVEAVSPGTAIITVRTANGLYDTCQVNVVQLSSAAFVVSDGRGARNDTLETTVHLVKNPGIAAFTLEVQYDASALTPAAVTAEDLLAAGSLASDVDDAAGGTLHITWYSAEDAAGDGPAFTIRWQTLDQTGSFPISLHYGREDICNAEKIEVYVNKEDGTARVLDRPVGDIYHDDQVNMKDIVCFARYFNELETLDEGQRLAADLFYDEKIDVKDLTALAQLLSESLPDAPAAFFLARAGEPFEITVSNAVAAEDGDVELSVTGAGCTGIAAMRFRVIAPEGFKVLSVEVAELLADCGMFGYNSETGIVTWYSDRDEILNGQLFIVRLRRTGQANLPDAVRLEHSGADFFSVYDYGDVPVSVSGGELTEPVTAKIASVRLEGTELAADVRVVPGEAACLLAAFYQNGRMTSTVQTEAGASGVYRLRIPNGAMGSTGAGCKLFLLNADTYAPLAPCWSSEP